MPDVPDVDPALKTHETSALILHGSAALIIAEQVSPSNSADVQTTLNKLGVAVAASFFIPQVGS